MQREDGWKNYRMSYGRIEPLLGGQLEKPPFRCLMGRGYHPHRNRLFDIKNLIIQSAIMMNCWKEA